MAFGGLWEGYRWPDETITRTFTIVATTASADVAGLHYRMPVILAGGLTGMVGRGWRRSSRPALLGTRWHAAAWPDG